MSRHIIRVNSPFHMNYAFESSIDFLKLQQIQNNFVNSSISIFTMPLNPMKAQLGPIYYQNTRLFQREPHKKPEYNTYTKVDPDITHIEGTLTDDLYDVIFNNSLVSLNQDKFETLNEHIDHIHSDLELVMTLDFEKYCGRQQSNINYMLFKKTFMRKKDNILEYYYDEQTPSLIELKKSDVILCHEEDLEDDTTNKTYLATYFYSNLNVVVNVTINPDKSKIVPAIIVLDANNNPLEVHCYYNGEYITPELMNALKPNILLDDFKAESYFNYRDIEFLEMVRI